MGQSSQFDNFDPFFSPPPPPLPPSPPTNASNALSLPPEATYTSKEALFEAIQSWAKPRGYAFSIRRSSKLKDGRQKVTFACDRRALMPPLHHQRSRDTQTRGLRCPFSVLALEGSSLGWEARYRSKARFNTHNLSRRLAAGELYHVTVGVSGLVLL